MQLGEGFIEPALTFWLVAAQRALPSANLFKNHFNFGSFVSFFFFFFSSCGILQPHAKVVFINSCATCPLAFYYVFSARVGSSVCYLLANSSYFLPRFFFWEGARSLDALAFVFA